MLMVRMKRQNRTTMKKNATIRVACALGLTVLWLAGCGQQPVNETQKATPQSSRTSASMGGARYDLEKDEGRGHTLKKHVGRTDEELLERLQRERDISAASTWTDRDAAEETVGSALKSERGKIENWERRGYPRSNLALHFDAGRVIGRSIRQGKTQSLPCTNAVIVLKADGPDSFFVLTTYPEARE
jgi:toxin